MKKLLSLAAVAAAAISLAGCVNSKQTYTADGRRLIAGNGVGPLRYSKHHSRLFLSKRS